MYVEIGDDVDESVYHLPEDNWDAQVAAMETEEVLPYVPVDVLNLNDARQEINERLAKRTCVICMDRNATVIFIPCGHVCVCKMTKGSMTKGKGSVPYASKLPNVCCL